MLALFNLIRKPWLLIAVAVLGAFAGGFWRGHSAGSDAARVSQLEAEIAAVRDRARREAALARRLEREKNDLREALDTIDAEDPITGDGADAVLGSDFLCRIRAKYDPDVRCSPTLPTRNFELHQERGDS